MSGAEYTASMSLPKSAPAGSFHYLQQFDTFDEFLKNVKKPGNVHIDAVPQSGDSSLVFDLVGTDCSIANAIRRVILNEVATIAIEKVVFLQNTGIMQDEKLAHRLGLIPILADPSEFAERPAVTGEPEATENDTLVFELEVECTEADIDRDDPARLSKTIYSRDLKWIPHGSQAEKFKGREPKPFHDDIIVTRLAVGQKIKAVCFAQKGVGYDHCKWQPATVFYRQLPVVRLLKDVEGEEAKLWKKHDVANVFDLVPGNKKGSKKLEVARPRNCTMAKNFLLLPDGKEKLLLDHKEDHFLFTIEPIGQIAARDVLLRSLQVLKQKAKSCIESLDGVS